ncbi:hypothetical protein PanWU01x14_165750 [Parasponia andersonii]|uniref:Uncharacterized protein n=1 Tax=Parasponia andersonii TaxID=3476 RepID=A0A2P5CC26_PARAD|nr:hypothetical protein PanWU01x14_165750 [Parasponia andersonii]
MEMDKTSDAPLLVHDHFNYSYYDQVLEDNNNKNDGEDDAISLCNFSNGNDEENDVVSYNDDPNDAFEFSTTETLLTTGHTETLLFCGKSIPCRLNSKLPISFPQTTSLSQTPHATSSFSRSATESGSLNNGIKAQSSRFHNVRTATTTTTPPPPPRSSSLRLPEARNSRYLQNYSSSSSICSRKHNVLIGLTKFPPKMELSEIRKRQSRRAPVPMFSSAACGGDQPVVAGGQSGGKGNWGLLRPLRFRSNLVSALARVSFGCIRHV